MRVVSVLLLLCLCAIANIATGKDVVMAFSQNIPPYTFPETDSGIELDVMREALAYRGHRLLPSYFPLGRLPLAFRYGRVDATTTDLGQDLTAAGGHYADPAVPFDNVLITLKERNIRIEQPEDLSNLLVIAFVGASQRYPKWIAQSKKMGLYYEQADQQLQAQGLLRNHFDVMLSDRYIYLYFAHKLARERGIELKPITEHHFVTLDLQDYRPVFRDPTIRDDFNAGLKYLKESGRFDAIYNGYLEVESEGERPHPAFAPQAQ